MHQCEKMIFDDIENITKERLAPTVIDIKRDIKYAFWHGFINEKIYYCQWIFLGAAATMSCW